jgi:DNA polymerase III alpha subunit
MKSDKLGFPIFEESDIFDLLYQGIDIKKYSSEMILDQTESLNTFQSTSNLSFLKSLQNEDISLEEFDKLSQNDWFIPDDYKNMDIEEFLVHMCPEQNYQRLIDELNEFKSRNMLNLLRWLKYLVDTMRKNNIVWGVGRGSSVASYVLFLLGVHKIDSIKYNLDWQEFLR